MDTLNEQWLLVRRPQGDVQRSDFEVRRNPLPRPGPGQVLVRNIYMVVPASMRLWMNEAPSYFPPQTLGKVMMAGTLGVIEASDVPGFEPGLLVNTFGGWQRYCVMRPEQLQPVKPHPRIELAAYRSIIDVQGTTAYGGLFEVCQPQPGETLVVTAAAGSVGSLVGQMAKICGLRVIGVAGGPAKCRWITEELGFDGAIDYRHEEVAARLQELAPRGIDCVFENVGGPVFDAILGRIKKGARIALCGLVAQYSSTDGALPGYSNLMQVVYQSARIQGFMVLDFIPRFAEILPKIEQWILEGRLKYQLDYSDGLESAVEAMRRLARGENRGMGVVRISAEP